LRNTLVKLHSVFGLYLFGIMALLFLSGSVLVFAWELETSLNGDIRLDKPAVTRGATVGQIFDGVRSFDPALRPVFIERSTSARVGDRVFAGARAGVQLNVWTHPDTGKVLGVSGSGVRGVIFEFHTSFMTGERVGAALASGFSLLLLGFVVTGVLTYRRFWRAFVILPPGRIGTRIWWAGLHRLMAVWLLPFMLLIAVTGSFYFSTTTGLVSIQFPKADPVSARDSQFPEGFDGAALDRAVDVARAALPGLEVTIVNLPFSPRHGIVVFGHGDEVFRNERSNKITVDPLTFQVLGVLRSQDLTFLQRYAQLNGSAHVGSWGGFYSRVLWLGLGLAGTFLTLSGAMVYASRLASVTTTQGRSAAGRIWFTMGILKWGLVIYGISVVGLAIVRFGG